MARLQSSNELQQRRHVMARNCRPAISGNQLQPVGRHGQQCSPENQNLMTSTPLWLVNDHVLTMSCNGVQAWLPLINANVGEPSNLYEEEVVVVGKSNFLVLAVCLAPCQERKKPCQEKKSFSGELVWQPPCEEREGSRHQFRPRLVIFIETDPRSRPLLTPIFQDNIKRCLSCNIYQRVAQPCAKSK